MDIKLPIFYLNNKTTFIIPKCFLSRINNKEVQQILKHLPFTLTIDTMNSWVAQYWKYFHNIMNGRDILKARQIEMEANNKD